LPFRLFADDVLRDKVAFITGAGSGIGRALALRWASKGVRLALNDFNHMDLEQTWNMCQSIKDANKDVLLLPGDVTLLENHTRWINEILAHFGKLDVLVNNAGKVVQGLCAGVPFQTEKSLFDVNLMAPIGLTKAALPNFKERKAGYIVQVGSVLSRMPSPATASYGASKAAVLVSRPSTLRFS
jgi:short-subunit dehydrogenase